MSMKKQPKTGKSYVKASQIGTYDNSHHLLEIKQIPDSLTQLRQELTLPQNKDIFDYAMKGDSIEECLARIAVMLDIVLDGLYDMSPLCDVLLTAMRNRANHPNQPHLRVAGLVEAEIIETDGEVTLHEVSKEVPELAPTKAKLITEIN